MCAPVRLLVLGGVCVRCGWGGVCRHPWDTGAAGWFLDLWTNSCQPGIEQSLVVHKCTRLRCTNIASMAAKPEH